MFDYFDHILRQFSDGVDAPHEGLRAPLWGELRRFQYDSPYLLNPDFFARVNPYLLNTVIPHKIAVYKAGIELLTKLRDVLGLDNVDANSARVNLFLHDMSKLSTYEYVGYAFYNFRDKDENTPEVRRAFELAWHHHKANNPHHPEHWLDVSRTGKVQALPMPALYVFEMLADWVGAGRTYGQEIEAWLPNNLSQFMWHKETADLVEAGLRAMDLPGRLTRMKKRLHSNVLTYEP